MKEFKFNHEKNQQLKIIRGICFEDIIEKIKRDRQVKAIEHPNKKDIQNKEYF